MACAGCQCGHVLCNSFTAGHPGHIVKVRTGWAGTGWESSHTMDGVFGKTKASSRSILILSCPFC